MIRRMRRGLSALMDHIVERIVLRYMTRNRWISKMNFSSKDESFRVEIRRIECYDRKKKKGD